MIHGSNLNFKKIKNEYKITENIKDKFENLSLLFKEKIEKNKLTYISVPPKNWFSVIFNLDIYNKKNKDKISSKKELNCFLNKITKDNFLIQPINKSLFTAHYRFNNKLDIKENEKLYYKTFIIYFANKNDYLKFLLLISSSY